MPRIVRCRRFPDVGDVVQLDSAYYFTATVAAVDKTNLQVRLEGENSPERWLTWNSTWNGVKMHRLVELPYEDR